MMKPEEPLERDDFPWWLHDCWEILEEIRSDFESKLLKMSCLAARRLQIQLLVKASERRRFCMVGMMMADCIPY